MDFLWHDPKGKTPAWRTALDERLADAQRRQASLTEDHRRSEAALRESQRKVDELQQKLDALLAIDRDTRRRPKTSAK